MNRTRRLLAVTVALLPVLGLGAPVALAAPAPTAAEGAPGALSH